jgi:hypothetical protein
MKKFMLTCLAIGLMVVFWQVDLYAQETDDASLSTQDEDLSAEQVRDMARRHAREVLQNLDYAEPNYQNISKLYWAFGLFDAKRDHQAVNKYLMINECEIYSEYFNNDFEWKKIHSATSDFLEKNRKNFPRRFEFSREINLGRYDFEKEAFYVEDEKLHVGTRIYEMTQQAPFDSVCGGPIYLEGYPRAVVLNLSRPFTMKFVPVPPDEAHDFIARSAHEKYESSRRRNRGANRSTHERYAYLSIRVRVLKYQGVQRTVHGYDAAKLFVILEGYDVYEDPSKKKLLFSTRG